MRGRSALVTGSTRGTGAAIAAALAAEGCNVMLNGFGDTGAKDVRELCASTGITGTATVTLDLRG